MIRDRESGLWLPPMRGAADWPGFGGGQQVINFGADTANSLGTGCTKSGTAHTKGSWEVLLTAANNTVEADWIVLQVTASDDSMAFLLDIGVGDSGSEKVLIPNLLHDQSQQAFFSNMVTQTWSFPLHISAGTRISARCQGTGTFTRDMLVSGQLIEGDMMFGPGYSKCEAWGVSTAGTSGDSIDPGTMVDTLGAWSALEATTNIEAKALVVSFGNQLNNERTVTFGWLTDIGVGALDSEEVLIPQIFHHNGYSGVAAFSHGPHGIFPVNIATGERVSARAQCGITEATDRLFDIVIYAVGN